MAKIPRYVATTINKNILSELNVDQEGDVVSAAVWKKLWSTVLQQLDKYNTDFKDNNKALQALNNELSDCAISVSELEITAETLKARTDLLEITWTSLQDTYDEIQETQKVLEESFVHYGDTPPTSDLIKLWVMPSSYTPQIVTAWGDNDEFAQDNNIASAALVKTSLDAMSYKLQTKLEDKEELEVETNDSAKKTIRFKQDATTLSAVLEHKAVVLGNANPELDNIAYAGKTYREIFVDSNSVPIGNFFDDKFTAGDFPSAGVDGFTVASGSPKITDEAYYSSGLSLKVSGTSPNYIRRLGNNPGGIGTYYVAFKGRVDRYVSGNCGVQIASSSTLITNNVLNAVTDGFVTSSCIVEGVIKGTTFNIGAYGTVDLEGFIDDIVAVNLSTMFDEIPAKETMDALYEQYLDIVKEPTEVVIASEEIIISSSTDEGSEDESSKVEYTDAECVSAFMEKVNEKAAELGMTNSIFITPSGAGINNSSTVHDLVKLLISASGYDELVKVWGKPSKTIYTKNDEPTQHDFTSNMYANMNTDEGTQSDGKSDYYFMGGKTGTWIAEGYTTYNFGAICKVGDKLVAGVVMGATSDNHKYRAINQLFDIAKQVIENPDTDTSGLSVSYATCACCCVVPEYNVFMYENYPFEYLFEQNADTVKLPASITKVITSMVMLDYIKDLNETITFNSSDDDMGGSGNVFSNGDTITYRDALYALMLPSSNMTAQCVARHIGRKILKLG